jgi:hypothetical protein
MIWRNGWSKTITAKQLETQYLGKTMEELFDRETIALNRAGKLTDAQQKKLSADTNPNIWLIMSGFLGLVGALFYALLSSPESDLNLRYIILGIVGFCLLITAWRGTRLLLMRRKLLSDQLLSETGTVSFKKLDAFDRLRYSPETDGALRLYPGGLAGLSANLPPGRFRFYYLPTQHWLLSAEPISSLEELTRNYNEILARFFKYSQEDLDKYRELARTGQVLVADGPLSFPIHTVDRDSSHLPVPLKIGSITFFVDPGIPGIALSGLPHRIYYYPPDDSFLGGVNKPRLLAVEVL